MEGKTGRSGRRDQQRCLDGRGTVFEEVRQSVLMAGGSALMEHSHFAPFTSNPTSDSSPRTPLIHPSPLIKESDRGCGADQGDSNVKLASLDSRVRLEMVKRGHQGHRVCVCVKLGEGQWTGAHTAITHGTPPHTHV